MTEPKAVSKKTGGRTAGSKSLTERQKAEACELYKTGEMTLDELAKRFGRTPRAMSALFAKEGVKKGEKRAEVQAAVSAHVQQQMLSDSAIIAAKIKETKEAHYNAAKVIAGLITNQLVSAQRDKKTFASVMDEVKTLKLAAEALSTLRAERFEILGIAKGEPIGNDDLPELPIMEMTAGQILEMQGRQENSGLDMDDDGEHAMPVLTHDMGLVDAAP